MYLHVVHNNPEFKSSELYRLSKEDSVLTAEEFVVCRGDKFAIKHKEIGCSTLEESTPLVRKTHTAKLT